MNTLVDILILFQVLCFVALVVILIKFRPDKFK